MTLSPVASASQPTAIYFAYLLSAPLFAASAAADAMPPCLYADATPPYAIFSFLSCRHDAPSIRCLFFFIISPADAAFAAELPLLFR